MKWIKVSTQPIKWIPMMFRGQFQHAIDAKGRVSLPSRFRDGGGRAQESSWVLAPALFDRCLHLFPLEAWQRLEEKIADLPSMDPNFVRFRRLYVSAACECELDKPGRILVPGHLRERVELKKDVLWAGMGRHLELWSTEHWQSALALEPAEEAAFKQAVLEQIKI